VSARRWWGWPLVPAYGAALALKDGLRRAGLLRTRRLKWPVVSVGSLSAGGAGKTPVVIALAELLRERSWMVDVISRGYGRSGRGVERVDAQGGGAAGRFGDEPVLIARRTGAPVWVGADRFAAGVAAEVAAEAPGRGLHLLDDGFQHRGLARALDAVVVTAEDLEEALLPAGNRREGLSALRRADVVVLREEEWERVLPKIAGLLPPAATRTGAGVWRVRRTLDCASATAGFEHRQGLIAFCAIARPGNFVEMLRGEGARVVDSIEFPDHHRYTAGDMHRLTEALRAKAGSAFVTTEKDEVKITPAMRATLAAAAPVLVARLQVGFVDADAVVRELEGRTR
jgi:tetraacyldisaccharide 4'-kinase